MSIDFDAFKKDLSHSFDQTLKAELSSLELRLVDRLSKSLDAKADAAVVIEMDKRLQSLEQSRASNENLPGLIVQHDRRLTMLERFRYTIPSAAVISLVISAVLLYYAWRSGTHPGVHPAK